MKKLNQLAIIKNILYNSSVFTTSYVPVTFFDYYFQKTQLEIFQKCLKTEFQLQLVAVKHKTKKNRFRWVRRVVLTLTILLSAYFFVGVPHALACTVLQNKVVRKTIWDILAKEEETKTEKKSSYVSKKVLIVGGIVLTLAISAILFHQTGMARKLFSPKLEEIPTNTFSHVANTLEEIDLLKKINFDQNIRTRIVMVHNIVNKFGIANWYALRNGEVKIDALNNQQIFTFLTHLLRQAISVLEYEHYVKGIDGIEQYVNNSGFEQLTQMKRTLLGGLNKIIVTNPNRLFLFKDYMEQLLNKIEPGKFMEFTPEKEKELVQNLLAHYLYQNMLDGVKPYYEKLVRENK
jgi:hypothetical protein